MKGLELAKAYYEAFGLPLLEAFPEAAGKVAVGLCGGGSECLGYDDELSQDHDFELGFCIFIPGEELLDRKSAFALERAYARLPKEFMGFKKSFLSPAGGNRHGVVEIRGFFQEKLGNAEGKLSLFDWLRLPEQSILEAANGEIWRDDSDLMTSRRAALQTMPEDIRLKKLAGELLTLSQAGQYNYPRLLARKDAGAAGLALAEAERAALHCIFLLNRRLMPYYKWQFRALRDLPLLSELAEPLANLSESPNRGADGQKKLELLALLEDALIRELKAQSLSDAVCGDLSRHALSVNDRVKDPGLRNASVLAAV